MVSSFVPHVSSYNLMLACWSVDKKIRPTFSQLVLMLADVRDSFYDTVEVKERPDVTFSNIKLRRDSRAGTVVSARQPSVSGSTSTVQTDAPYAHSSVQSQSAAPSSGYESGKSELWHPLLTLVLYHPPSFDGWFLKKSIRSSSFLDCCFIRLEVGVAS